MFALLEHRPDQPSASSPLHWDLLLEVPNQEKLPTWRLLKNPLEAADPIPAQRIADHRRIYLEYEGPISGGRGHVRRLDRGQTQILHLRDPELLVELHGRHLHGLYEIVREHTGQLIFRPAAQS
jgi:hypothetical protein